MHISRPTVQEASGPTSTEVVDDQVPYLNLPLQLETFVVEAPHALINWSTVSMKPIDMNVRQLQIQARVYLLESTTDSNSYEFTYVFDPSDEVYDAFRAETVLTYPAMGQFTLQGSFHVWNANDYWSFDLVDNRLRLRFHPTADMNASQKYMYFTIVV